MYPYSTDGRPQQIGRVQPNSPVYPNNGAWSSPKPDYPKCKGQNNKVLNTLQARLRLSQAAVTILPSVIACVTVQAVAAFFFTTTVLTFVGVVPNARDFSDDPNHDGNVLYIVFSVFLAFGSAMCAPIIQNSGYSPVITAGAVLMLFSTMSSSLVTAADILVIPYSVFGACGYALLKTGPQVAMLDFLNDRRGLATALSYLGVTVGQVVGSMTFAFSDMKDDAYYDGSRAARWPNNLRIIEVTAVLALFASTIIRRPSFTTGSWPQLFQYVPFYFLCCINFFVSLGFDLLTTVYSVLPDDRDFRSHPKGAHTIFTVSFISQLVEFGSVSVVIALNALCSRDGRFQKLALFVSAISVAVLALGSYINEATYEEFSSFVVYACVAGFVKAMFLVSLPLALITLTGRLNYKIGLPFLETAGGLGALVSYIIKDDLEAPDDEPIETIWYIAAAAFTLVAGVSVWVHFRYKPWQLFLAETEANQEEINQVEAIENASFMPEDVIPDGVLGADDFLETVN